MVRPLTFAWLCAALASAPTATADDNWRLTGRYHGQHYWVDADDEGSDNGWEHRRFRVGGEGPVAPGLRLVGDVDLDTGRDTPFVDKLNTGYLDWRPAPGWTVTAGKLRRNPLTREDGIGTNELVTMERALLTSRRFVLNHGGIAVTRRTGPWTLSGVVLSAREEDDFGLPTLGGGFAFIGNVARRFGDSELRIDVLHNEGGADANVVAPYRDVISVNGRFVRGSVTVLADLIGARSRRGGPGDIGGAVVSVEWRARPGLHFVARAELTQSGRNDGIRLPARYERQVNALVAERGDDYRALYAGVRYDVAQRWTDATGFALLAGLQQSRLERPGGALDAVTATVGLRLYF